MKQHWAEIVWCAKISGGLWLMWALVKTFEAMNLLERFIEQIHREQVEDGVTMCGRVECE